MSDENIEDEVTALTDGADSSDVEDEGVMAVTVDAEEES